MQKIIIKYLGPVRELEMEIKDFNLLIGEQATGKSTVAKAIYFFRIIKSTLHHYFYHSHIRIPGRIITDLSHLKIFRNGII